MWSYFSIHRHISSNQGWMLVWTALWFIPVMTRPRLEELISRPRCCSWDMSTSKLSCSPSSSSPTIVTSHVSRLCMISSDTTVSWAEWTTEETRCRLRSFHSLFKFMILNCTSCKKTFTRFIVCSSEIARWLHLSLLSTKTSYQILQLYLRVEEKLSSKDQLIET